ncbi:MAG: HAD family hydrolase [Gammaproteobacteria bacterium]|nr:HAD family hydrolase [Gammaproteobacteria bacterium]
MPHRLYALDFDGVICDSAVETGITGWKVASSLWSDMPDTMPEHISELFRQVRPVMETGYEAILIVRILFEGSSAQRLLTNFSHLISQLLRRDQLNSDELKQQFGQTRDHWINENINEWIAMNPLFNGIADKLQQIESSQCYIITTKQERFVHQILQANSISVPEQHVYGLDRGLSKQHILADLLATHPQQSILFVEDRLPTLSNVISDSRLANVELYFADWGYNTEQDKKIAATTTKINTLSLSDMMTL